MASKLKDQLEWITGLAVVISLIVLIVEVRANTQAIEREILIGSSARLAEPFLSGPELFSAYERVKAVDGWEPMTEAFMEQYDMESAEAIAWLRYLIQIWQGVEADFAYSGRTQELESRVRSLLGYPDNQLYWSVAPAYSDEFEAFVESVVPDAAVRSESR